MRFMKKVIASVCALGVLGSIVMPSQAKAYGYDHRFKQPFEGCVEQTGCHPVTAHPQVQQTISCEETTMYWLTTPGNPTDRVSNYKKASSPIVLFFTYNDGVSLKNRQFSLTYCPTRVNFGEYHVCGNWTP